MVPNFLMYGVIAVVFAICLCKIPGTALKGKRLLWHDFFLIRLTMFAILTYHFYLNLMFGFNPYNMDYFTMPDNPKVISYFQQTDITVQKPLNKPLKNLIMLHLECTEKRSIGLFNKHFPNLMPFLQSLAKKGTFLNNVTMMKDQSYTLSSVFAQRSGLPMLGYSYKKRGSLLMSKRVHTIMDFFNELGYDQMASCTGFCSVYKFYNLHHMRSLDYIYHGQRHDYGHFEYLVNTFLPKLLNEQKKHPFFLIIHNEDTHPDYYVDKRCLDILPDEIKNKWPLSLITLQCLDISLEKFFKKLSELGLDKTSEVFIYGDHLLWGEPYYYDKPRQMLMLFPFKEQQMINKPISLFDVAPSIMKLMGIENYSPEFPFGFDFFSQNTTKFPTDKDRQYINNIAHFFQN